MVKKTIPEDAMAAMQAKRQEVAAARRAAGLGVMYTPVEKALDDPKSKTKAIAAACYQCQGEDADPCWQWRVGNCTIKKCGLWQHRPHQRLLGSATPKALLTQFDAAS